MFIVQSRCRGANQVHFSQFVRKIPTFLVVDGSSQTEEHSLPWYARRDRIASYQSRLETVLARRFMVLKQSAEQRLSTVIERSSTIMSSICFRYFFSLSALFAVLALSTAQARAATCTTQAQMTAEQRSELVDAARAVLTEVQAGNIQAIRANTLPAIASDFNGIQRSIEYLEPLVRQATITVDDLYLLDASNDPPNQGQTDFFCGSPVVGLDFNNLPPGIYALAITRATGVKEPQQISLIFAKSQAGRWLLAGFFDKPMVLDGRDGVWYWTHAREYAHANADWAAHFYYGIAVYLLDPVQFLASPNLEQLRHESDSVHAVLPSATTPMMINAGDAVFKVTAIDTTTEFGPLDLDVHYLPNATQLAQLRDPAIARQQVTDLMNALLRMHPDLRSAFHGMWLHADQGNASLFALELPMPAAGREAHSTATP